MELKSLIFFPFRLKSGKIKRVYDNETQNKIDILNTHINLVADNYKSQYPKLFRYNN